MTQTNELEAMKRQISLLEFAIAEGYAIDKRATSRNSAVLRHSDGDKVIVARGRDEHWIYFSVRDAADSGSIIDFLQHRKHLTLGEVRKELRPFLSGQAVISDEQQRYLPAMEPIERDLFWVRKSWEAAEPLVDGINEYLNETRQLPASLLSQPFLRGRIAVDERFGNVMFPHFDHEGLCGYEIKNENFTGFAKGGRKGLWYSQINSDDTRLVIAETAIDAISFAALEGWEDTRFFSTGGEMSPEQRGLVSGAMKKMTEGATIVLAMDADNAGEKLRFSIRKLSAQVGRGDLQVVDHEPPGGSKDWNDALRESRDTTPKYEAKPKQQFGI